MACEQPTQGQIKGKFHFLKADHDIFCDVKEGKKLFDYRKNDRDFKVGDWINLTDYYPKTKSSGDSIDLEITYIMHGGKFGLPDGYCIMQLKRLRGMYHG